MQLRALSVTLLLTLVLGGCGGASRPRSHTTESARKTAPQRDPLSLPAGVPTSPTRPADASATRTIRAWSKALRAGDLAGATALWALPARIQNGTPVLTLGTRGDVRSFNESLSCGAVLTGAGAARGYTIATFRLTERRGGQCGTGVGQSAQTAVLVRAGRIAGWYRLPDTTPGPVI
ncbi:MAG: hypothetical protein QOE11_1956 [Solirubrobacteraceae bacterium]|nr:hypothetical protein [Solirubrobacteraceae bacterium]